MQSVKNQAVSQQSAIQLPRFDKQIQVEVDMDELQKRIQQEFPDDYKHKELLSHAIVGNAMEHGGLGNILGAINGFSPMIDFKVGDIVMCTEVMRRERYDAKLENADGTPKPVSGEPVDEPHTPRWETRTVAIGKCTVVEVNLYANKKLVVAYEEANRYNDKMEMTRDSVSHKSCTKWAVEVVA